VINHQQKDWLIVGGQATQC